MLSPIEKVRVFQSELDDLERYLSKLSPESLVSPSACERWSVADVVAHMASAFESYTGSIIRGLRGDSSASPGRPDPGTWSTASSAERVLRAEEAAHRVVTYREYLGDRLLPTLHTAVDGFNQLLAGMGAQDWEKLCYHGRGEIPAQNLVTYAILEACLHKWDIQSKLEANAQLSSGGSRALIEHIEEFMHWAFVTRPEFTGPRRYRFRLTGEISLGKEVIIDCQAHLAGNDGRAVDAVFECNAESLLLLMCGRINFSDALAGGLLVIEGNDEMASAYSVWSQAI